MFSTYLFLVLIVDVYEKVYFIVCCVKNYNYCYNHWCDYWGVLLGESRLDNNLSFSCRSVDNRNQNK